MTKPLPCPFCGVVPEVRPACPEKEGNAWGEVLCVNPECPAQPSVLDGVDVSDDRGSLAYIEAAIERWNRRFPTDTHPHSLTLTRSQSC